MTLPVADEINFKDFKIVVYPVSVTDKFPGFANEFVLKKYGSTLSYRVDLNALWEKGIND